MTPTLEARCARLLAAILLARVDGKSPVEYLQPPKQQIVRAFAVEALLNPAPDFDTLLVQWRSRIL
ncbi:MAG: hypothetical protein LV479_07000 [Methylacidiphilales bacterium]|nr:hypothetical protein [Candidatus Methylacidiphilales bacterium]